MKKTIREWLKTLPEEYKRKALMNATLLPNENIDDREYYTCFDTLYYAFEWGNTPEGFTYWGEAYYKIRYTDKNENS